MLKGKFIGVKEKTNVFVLEYKFTVRSAKKVTLFATALGVYFAEVNGVRVGDAYLAPGWTSYQKMVQVQEYDITPLVKEGENILSLAVNEGWCCGPLTWERKRGTYGKQPAVCADLIVDGRVILSTDESWTAHESYIRGSGIYDGETVDLTAECKPLTPVAIPFDKKALIPQICEFVRTTERLPVQEVIRTPKGDLVYDFGQNLAGVVEVLHGQSAQSEGDGYLYLQGRAHVRCRVHFSRIPLYEIGRGGIVRRKRDRPRPPHRYEADGVYPNGQRALSAVVRKHRMGTAGKLCGHSHGLPAAGRAPGLDGGFQRVLPHGSV